MNPSKPAALLSALFRARAPLVAAAVVAALGTTPAGAQTQPAKSAGKLVAQAQPQQPTPQGQTFEEEIVPQRYANNAKVDAFIDEMVSRNGFDSTSLHALFSRISYSATAVKLVKPAPSPTVKNWRVYRSRFIEPIRINAGVKFWKANQATLQRASEQFGVPPEVIVGIIGVETIYGRYMGNFRVLDALTTLTFDYPDTPNRDSRQATFRKNLEDFLVWTRDNQLDPTTVLGSEAGRDRDPSVPAEQHPRICGRLRRHGPCRPAQQSCRCDRQRRELPEATRLGNRPTGGLADHARYGQPGIAQAAADGQPEPHWALSQLLRAGMTLNEPTVNITTEGGTPVTVVDLPSPGRATEYMLGLKNFYVLTRYNRSFFYALTVYQLGEAVKAQMEASGALQPATVDTEPQ